ncbi:MAG: hypothetical protein RLZZ214_492 [Verrucomicrobiota bacterium]
MITTKTLNEWGHCSRINMLSRKGSFLIIDLRRARSHPKRSLPIITLK